MSLELGNVLTASANYFDATADWWAGDAEEAVRKLRRVVEALQAMGERGYLSIPNRARHCPARSRARR